MLHPRLQETEEALRAEGHVYTFTIQSDCILCNETQGCYAAESFKVEEIHAFGSKHETRRLLYAIVFEDGDRGMILGLARELEIIEDPELYSKLMVI
ncbi:MAG: hypothetical protein SFY70_05575 [Bacteroidia bacterium]|nr:hypothetical protein [Bacteroidia bacterium]